MYDNININDMKEQDRIEKYLFLMKLDFSKMMKAYFRMRSYESKLKNMNLNDRQSKQLKEQQKHIEDCMKILCKHE